MNLFNTLACETFSGIYARLKHMEPLETGKILENLFVLKTGTVNFYIYHKGDDYIALDSGFNKSLVRRELTALDINPDYVYDLFLSHSDFDHTGGIDVFQNTALYLSHDEEQMITKTTPRKYGFVYNSKIMRAYRLLKDNDEVTIGSIKVKAIETPGHTPGSMSYLLDDSILFVGDAFKLLDGKVYPIGPLFSMDQERQKESLRKLAQFKNVSLALTGHRGYTKDFNNAIADWK